MSAPVPHTPQTLGGLCITCEHIEYCSFAAESPAGVWSCEEFSTRRMVRVPAPASSRNSGNLLPIGVETGGLCQNCEHLPTCRLDKPEGGVWHCEEYA